MKDFSMIYISAAMLIVVIACLVSRAWRFRKLGKHFPMRVNLKTDDVSEGLRSALNHELEIESHFFRWKNEVNSDSNESGEASMQYVIAYQETDLDKIAPARPSGSQSNPTSSSDFFGKTCQIQMNIVLSRVSDLETQITVAFKMREGVERFYAQLIQLKTEQLLFDECNKLQQPQTAL